MCKLAICVKKGPRRRDSRNLALVFHTVSVELLTKIYPPLANIRNPPSDGRKMEDGMVWGRKNGFCRRLLPSVRPNFDGNSRIAKCFFFGARSGARPTNELTDADGVLRRIASLFTPIASLVAPHADRAGQIQSATERIALGCDN